MKTKELVEASESLVQWNDSHIAGLKISSKKRIRLAAACLDMVHEHHKAIVLLCKSHLYGTAFAIVRLQFEAFVRGVWLHRCATEEDIEKYCADSIDQSFGYLVQQVETLPEFSGRALSIIKTNTWKAMNSYTHSGYQQAVCRNTTTSIASNYSQEGIRETLSFGISFAVAATMAVAQIADHPWLARAALEKQKEILKRSNQAL